MEYSPKSLCSEYPELLFLWANKNKRHKNNIGEAESAQGAMLNLPHLCVFGSKLQHKHSQTMLNRVEMSPALAASRSFPSFRVISLLSAAGKKRQFKRIWATDWQCPREKKIQSFHTLKHCNDFIIFSHIFGNLSCSVDYTGQGVVPQQQQDDFLPDPRK